MSRGFFSRVIVCIYLQKKNLRLVLLFKTFDVCQYKTRRLTGTIFRSYMCDYARWARCVHITNIDIVEGSSIRNITTTIRRARALFFLLFTSPTDIGAKISFHTVISPPLSLRHLYKINGRSSTRGPLLAIYLYNRDSI